jgi:mycothiol S-conjugate amidase
MHEKFVELGIESPFDEKWFERPSQDDRITTRIDVTGLERVRREALMAHATQVDPNSPFWFGLPPEAAADVYPSEDFILARSLVDSPTPEDDLFAGIREKVVR